EDLKKAKKSRGKSKEVCGYPLSIFFIIVNEFCERFSYYGMRAVLVLYFKYFLRWDDDLATSIYHTFVALCYLTPILGAIVADSWLGKFKTIIYLSIVYAVGQVAMAVSAIHDITDADRDGTPDNMTFHVAMSMTGLFLIALGTGGIKPCVSAFGGDQFSDHQERQRSTFFSVFYLCINGGSLLSTIITPLLRAQDCGIYTQQKCYALAFGVPAALMVVSLVVFIVGSGMYYKAKPQGNIMLDVCKCIGFSIKNRYRHRGKQFPKRAHWLDWAEEKYDKLLIAQIKMVLKVLFLYIPLPMFWTLFDQKGSRWTLQKPSYDPSWNRGKLFTVNPILILTLVPIMDSVIYPLIRKCGLNFTPLKRMTVGMLLAASAFVSAALVQVEIDKTLPVFPSSSQSQLKLLNMGNNPASDEYFTFETEEVTVSVASSALTTTILLTKGERQTLLIPAVINSEWLLVSWTKNVEEMKRKKTLLMLELNNNHFLYLQTTDLTAKPEQGNNAIRFINGLSTEVRVSSSLVDFGIIKPSGYSNYSLVENGKITFNLSSGGRSCDYSREFGYGSSFTFFIPNNLESITVIEDIKPNSVHMALQIPQYFLITAGEVMFSVTGLEFSYSQAPSNMKAVLQAGWLLTVAVGNFIVLIVAELAKLPMQWAEYVLFASLLVAVCIIFSIMAYFYTYIDPREIEAQFKKSTDDDSDDESRQYKKGLEMASKNYKSDYGDHKDGRETKM
uniref:Solute carrier family 15 member 1-like n=1 Tax=Salarias fasciatus TaxID=181472 RepID=A0A672IG49_SALFA